jgi:hypothetical protein
MSEWLIARAEQVVEQQMGAIQAEDNSQLSR